MPAADVFAAQEPLARHSRRLWLVYGIMLLSIGVLAGGTASLVVAYVEWMRPRISVPTSAYVFAGSAALVTTLLLFHRSARRRLQQLQRGGMAIARDLGAEAADNPHHRDQQRLRNVVEEMAIAAGIPAPPVYILRDEQGINAAAIGWSAADAVVVVTQGLLERLGRDDMQAVIAHEIAHLLHGDGHLKLRTAAHAHGLRYLLELVRSLATRRVRRKSDDGSTDETLQRTLRPELLLTGPFLLFLALFSLVAVGGSLCARILEAAIGRTREKHADREAVRLTRNPAALSVALRRIGGYALGSQLHDPRVDSMRFLFIAPVAHPRLSWFATHPPLAERIRAIDGQWDGSMLTPLLPASAQASAEDEQQSADPALGALGPALLWRLGSTLRAQCRQPHTASALLCALAATADGDWGAAEEAVVRERLGDDCARQVGTCLSHLAALTSSQRMTLLRCLRPALSLLDDDQQDRLRRCLKALVLLDRRMNWREFMLYWVARRWLGKIEAAAKPKRLADQHAARLLSALAQRVAPDQTALRARFATAWSRWSQQRHEPLSADLQQFETALSALARAPAAQRQRLLQAAHATVEHQEPSEYALEMLHLLHLAADLPWPEKPQE